MDRNNIMELRVIKTKVNQLQCVVFSSLEIVKLSSIKEIKVSNVFNQEGSTKHHIILPNPGQIDRKRNKVRTCSMKNASNKSSNDSLATIKLSR